MLPCWVYRGGIEWRTDLATELGLWKIISEQVSVYPTREAQNEEASGEAPSKSKSQPHYSPSLTIMKSDQY